MFTGRLSGFVLGAALIALGACEENEPCDANAMLVGTTCQQQQPDGGASEAGAGASTDATSSGSDAFGAPCTADDTCSAPTDYCAKMPGQAQGYCTATGCDKDPAKCPAGWTCFNLGMFTPGLPHMCRRP